MSDIFDLNANDPQKNLNRTVDEIVERSTNLVNSIVYGRQNIYNLVFNNNYGFSPQEVSTKLGTAAASLFIRDYKLVAFMADQRPDLYMPGPPSGLQVTVNQDGTVAITDTLPPTVSVNQSYNGNISINVNDNASVDVSTITSNNVSASGVTDLLTDVTINGTGKNVNATYVLAPSGGWGQKDNGDYNFTVSGIKDSSGNEADAVSGSFNINISL